ncbi:MAG TPA: GNAT family protein [Chloroflexaceae bacterium]|nr:GNAT family protein [Chloroflexaceae bacterium]
MADPAPARPAPAAPPGARVRLRFPTAADEAALCALNRASAAHYAPWVSPPADPAQYAAFLERAARPDVAALLICGAADDAPMGAVVLSQIFYGPLQSAYMGYYIGAPYAGQGYAAEGVALALDYAFGPLALHRVEANIQPGNTASLALVRRLGFTREGFSRRYLLIGGAWRDHERFAILAEDWASKRGVATTGG